ncbi:SDR family NAD(P)-dependent oxidoreductase [Streptomyces piniterrae]|uniref:SDR family NAD(P)-dependent oxidoreductase n=1 Tax=Streptomyces piniterrae TaxID=2571125 RepID=A0A4U0NR13_9ACTN|nr:SDR family NAD(P)-dependent oxidoreductase [Streptomyces piniterrae]TJZ56917.1 SDR family NAD(P)-dependent oxidoreductase [Streptomyces piniterrae]
MGAGVGWRSQDEAGGKETTGQEVTGQEVTGQEVTGQEVTGPEVTGPEVCGDEVGGAGVAVGGGSDGGVSEGELAALDRTVARLRALPVDDPVRLRAERVVGSFVRDGRLARRKAVKREQAMADAAVLAATATGARDRREDAPLDERVGESGELSRPRRCYVCKSLYREIDSFYHLLCPACAADNTARRSARTDLTGRRVLLTGGRVKIGFQLALMMLRDGAELLVTTRFPQDTVRRFRAVPGSGDWLDRLTVVGIDLRDPRQVLGLCQELRDEGRPLDILVNNAAQTVRRPPESYALLAAGERGELPQGEGELVRCAPGFRTELALTGATENARALELVLPTSAPGPQSLPGSQGLSGTQALPGQRDISGRPATVDEAGLLPDPAPVNSWSARIGELDPAELLETQLVNALAPALLCDRLLPLLLASPHPRRYVVNVTAVEGRFTVRRKTGGHPHTNMAKAALNMLTRTSGPELAAQGVHMCSVDTGWITDENPLPTKDRIAEAGFRTPLDIVDGAARVYDPIVRGEAGDPVAGVFLKDYREAEW